MAPLRQKLVLDASLHELIQREATPSARPSAAFGRHRVYEGFKAFSKLLPVGLLRCFLRARVRIEESLFCGCALALCNVELFPPFAVSSTSVAIAALPTLAVWAGPPSFAMAPPPFPPFSVIFFSRARSESFFSAWLLRSAWLLILLLLLSAWMLLSLRRATPAPAPSLLSLKCCRPQHLHQPQLG